MSKENKILEEFENEIATGEIYDCDGNEIPVLDFIKEKLEQKDREWREKIEEAIKEQKNNCDCWDKDCFHREVIQILNKLK